MDSPYGAYYSPSAAKFVAAVTSAQTLLHNGSSDSLASVDEGSPQPSDRDEQSSALDSTSQSFVGDVHPAWQMAPAEAVAVADKVLRLDLTKRPPRCAAFGGALSALVEGGDVRAFGGWVHCSCCRSWFDAGAPTAQHQAIRTHVISSAHMAEAAAVIGGVSGMALPEKQVDGKPESERLPEQEGPDTEPLPLNRKRQSRALTRAGPLPTAPIEDDDFDRIGALNTRMRELSRRTVMWRLDEQKTEQTSKFAGRAHATCKPLETLVAQDLTRPLATWQRQVETLTAAIRALPNGISAQAELELASLVKKRPLLQARRRGERR